MASEQTPLRHSFLFDPVATDLISFEVDGCNSTGYGSLGDPLLSFTGKDTFFGAPYSDASPLNEDHSPSQANNGLYQLFVTHAVTGPSPAQSPLAGLSPSAARLTAQIAAPSPSYQGHSGVDGNALTDLTWSRAQRVDDVVREPARLTDNVAAFTDARWPETRVGDAYDGRWPPCSAVDPFASRGDPEFPQPSVPSSLRVLLPEYSGYSDRISATEYLEALHQQVALLSDSIMLGSVLPVSLTAQAARWYRLVGHQARSMEEFRALFYSEFLPPEYERRIRRELKLRTQHPDESLIEYVRALQELYLLADPTASDAEKVERAIRQAHPTFAAYLRSARYRDLNELASDAKRIQGDILAARAYCPPPPPSASLEPRRAWAGRDSSHWGSPKHEAASAARDRDALDVSDRALDPYSYARVATVARQREQERKPRATVHEGISDRGAPTAASERTPRSSKGSPKSPPPPPCWRKRRCLLTLP
ncbi:hypothetical protein HPB51_009380 [Rhipicephalus microplus]|uniref:Retrotransposon gag domain-containing protein n=1 Tax=Rhipicephalus microplus TaxID=6941 RepID=A0A9J6F102_RHIMP|nr:hypothetical protein HPB51_009380 [Rhipicephalus microplus]